MHDDITLLQRGRTSFHLRRGWEDLVETLPLPELWSRHRGEALAFHARLGTVRAKRKCRGGLLSPLVPDLYSPLKVKALLSSYSEAIRRGMPAARLVGVVAQTVAPAMDRLIVVTEEISPSETLARRIAAGRAAPSELAALGTQVRALHFSGFLHGDLNAMNVLMPWGDGPFSVLDLDDARYTDGPVPPPAARGEILRLARSLVKRTPPSPRGDSSPYDLAGALFSGYTRNAAGEAEDLMRRLAAAVRWRRLFW